MRKEVWFGLTIMAMVVLAAFILLPPLSLMTNGHLGLLMLALVKRTCLHLLPQVVSHLSLNEVKQLKYRLTKLLKCVRFHLRHYKNVYVGLSNIASH